MASVAEHVTRAEANLRLALTLEQSGERAWAVIVLFYAALHQASALLARDGLDTALLDHATGEYHLDPRHPTITPGYLSLQGMSARARYLPSHEVDPGSWLRALRLYERIADYCRRAHAGRIPGVEATGGCFQATITSGALSDRPIPLPRPIAPVGHVPGRKAGGMANPRPPCGRNPRGGHPLEVGAVSTAVPGPIADRLAIIRSRDGNTEWGKLEAAMAYLGMALVAPYTLPADEMRTSERAWLDAAVEDAIDATLAVMERTFAAELTSRLANPPSTLLQHPDSGQLRADVALVDGDA